MKMRLSWADLVKNLKAKNAYDGDGSLDSVLEFVRDNEIPVRDKTGRSIDLEWLHKNKTVTISVAADAGEDVVMLGSKMSDEDDEESKSKMDDEDDEDGEKAVSHRLQKELDALKRKMDLAGSTGSKSTSVDAKLFQNRSERSAAHKSYDHRVQLYRNGHKFAKPPVFPDAETAEAFGATIRENWRKAHRLESDANDLAIAKSYLGEKAGQFGNQNQLGGALVPQEFLPDMVSLFQQYGITRRLFNSINITSDDAKMPREVSRPTGYWLTEGATITQSNSTFSNISFAPKKMAILVPLTNEILADSALNIADIVARGMAWRFSKMEDDAAFLGDGTSTYGGILGLGESMLDTDGSGTDSAGVVAGDASTASSWANFTIAPFQSAIGVLPNYVTGGEWVCHKNFYHTVMNRLALAAGGATYEVFISDYRSGTPSFLGYPVNFHPTMPDSAANTSADEIVAFFGEYSLGCVFADRQQIAVATSDQRYFDTDQIAMRATQRIDIVAHDVGDSSTVGPVSAITAE